MTDSPVAEGDQPEFPPIPQDLLEFLERRYPERCWQPGDDLDGVKFYGGKVDLVRLLRLEFTRQHTPPEEPTDVQ